MRYLRRWRSIGLCLALGLSCTASDQRGDVVATAVTNAEDLRWPYPPAAPRIAWHGAFTRPDDLGIRPSVWRRARRWIAGGPREHLVRPQGIAAVDGRLYLTDPARSLVLVYDPPRRRFHALHANAQRPWELPVSIAAMRSGTMFVADASGGVYRLVPPYKRATRLAWAHIQRPVAVAIDETRNRLYVLDAAAHQLHWGSLDGAYEGTLGRRGTGPGEFNFPTHLCIARDGSYWVTDAMNFRVQHFSPDGEPLGAFGKAGDGTGDFAKAKGIAIDSASTLYVVDAMHDAVQLFDTEGRFLMHFGSSGRKAGEFWLPTGIAVDEHDTVYVVDSYNRRVQMFRPVREEPL